MEYKIPSLSVTRVTRVDVLALWAEVTKRKPGGANNPHGRAGKPEGEEINLDNIQVDLPAPTGTSAAAGLRKLQKAASACASMVCHAWRREVGEVASPVDSGAKVEAFHLHDEVDHVAVLVCREAVI